MCSTMHTCLVEAEFGRNGRPFRLNSLPAVYVIENWIP
jgi:hypothetical protein